MQIIHNARAGGKTTKLIHLAKDYNGYIVCANQDRVMHIFKLSQKLKLDINQPMTFDEFLQGKYRGTGIKNVLIDDADELIQRISRVEVKAITMTKDE